MGTDHNEGICKKQGHSLMEVSKAIEVAAARANNRLELWASIINDLQVTSFTEVGVYKGTFAQYILQQSESLQTYYMIDPWRHLDDWNKPANTTNEEFVTFKQEALATTEFAAGKRVILEGKTTEVSSALPERGLDCAYIDGDHTLRGITIDLIRVLPKIRDGGILGGDDFCTSVWQHDARFEPTLVFPLAVYFAEGMGAVIYGLPFNQFAILVDRSHERFEFRDLTGDYPSLSLRDALGQTVGPNPVRARSSSRGGGERGSPGRSVSKV